MDWRRDEICCACGFSTKREDLLVRLWDGCCACSVHTKVELVAAPAVFNKLREVETRFYAEHLRNPGAVVWASRALAEFRCPLTCELEEQLPRLPDGVSVLMIPGDASPQMFAVDGVLASVLSGALGNKYCSEGDLKERARRLSSTRIAAKLRGVMA